MSDYKGQPDYYTAITVYNGMWKRNGWPECQISIDEYQRDPNSEKSQRFNEWWMRDMEETEKLRKEKMERKTNDSVLKNFL